MEESDSYYSSNPYLTEWISTTGDRTSNQALITYISKAEQALAKLTPLIRSLPLTMFVLYDLHLPKLIEDWNDGQIHAPPPMLCPLYFYSFFIYCGWNYKAFSAAIDFQRCDRSFLYLPKLIFALHFIGGRLLERRWGGIVINKSRNSFRIAVPSRWQYYPWKYSPC